MKRLFIFLFLFLYLHNFVGYLAVYSLLQYRVRTEIEGQIKASVPSSQLFLFAFHTASLERGEYPLQWVKDGEFRYRGGMYDIVTVHVSPESTHFQCINDVQEERLFENLDSHVRRHMGDSGEQGKLDAFKDVFKDSYTKHTFLYNSLLVTGTMTTRLFDEYFFIEPEVPFLPPRLSRTA